MRMRVMLVAGLLAVGACNPNSGGAPSDGAKPAGPAAAPKPGDDSRGAEIKAAPTTTPTQAAALPQGFPSADPVARAAECIVYIGLSQKAGVNPGGHDGTSLDLAVKQWRGVLTTQGKMNETEAQQLIASSVNPLTATPVAPRDAASAWCFDNAPVK